MLPLCLLSRGIVPSQPAAQWITEHGANYFHNCAPLAAPWVDLGKADKATACEAACQAHAGCQSWTWEAWGAPDTTCVGRTDGLYQAVQEGGHVSGRSPSANASSGCAPPPAPPPPTPPSSGCPQACNLNGVCDIGTKKCACDAAWTGDDCGQLALLPSPPTPAYGGPFTNYSSWGGGVLRAEGEYHMYVAEFLNGCGLQTWNKNSVCRHAVSDTPTGPFVAKEIVKGHFCHGPTPAFDSRTSTYLIMHDGDGSGGALCPADKCSNGTTLPSSPCRAGAMVHAGAENRTARQPLAGGPIMHATSPNGPWSDAGSPNWWNPAPWISQNGNVTVVYASDYMHISTAPTWEGPYTTDNKPLFSGTFRSAQAYSLCRLLFHSRFLPCLAPLPLFGLSDT